MRISNQVLFGRASASGQRLLWEMHREQKAISSGLRLESPSDHPTAVGDVMRASSSLRALDQYRDNLSTARSRLQMEDGVLQQLSDVLIRAKELAVSQAGSTASAQTRSVTAEEIRRIRSFVVELGNTRYGEAYLFGGDYADAAPLTGSGVDPSRPPVGSARVEGGPGAFYALNHGAQEVFVDSGVLAALEGLEAALAGNSEEAIRHSIGALDQAFHKVQNLVGDLGARMSQTDLALHNLQALRLNLEALRSDLQDADIAEAVTRLVHRQTAYQAAMMATARIMESTLTHYLR